jgi:nucleotide-binding universal stress UspA family protein
MYKRILVAIDGSRTSKRALSEATKLAKVQRANLRLIYIADERPGYMADPMMAGKLQREIQKEVYQIGRKILMDSSAKPKQARINFDTKLIVKSDPRQQIGDVINGEAKRWRANLIVIGTHGRRGLNRLALGSVAETVIRLAKQPVLVIRAH